MCCNVFDDYKCEQGLDEYSRTEQSMMSLNTPASCQDKVACPAGMSDSIAHLSLSLQAETWWQEDDR